MNAQVRRNMDLFSALAEKDDYWPACARRNDLIERVIVEFGLNSGTLADVGCFTGATTERFKALGFRHAVGFDASEAALRRAAGRVEARYWLIGEGPCPATDGEFDVVLAADVIEHLVDTDSLLLEARRILSSRGHLIVTTPNLAFWVSRLRLLQGRIPWSYPGASASVKLDAAADLAHIRVSTMSEWQELFRTHHFGVRAVRGWSAVPGLCGRGRPLLRFVDYWMTRFPRLAFGLLFVLEKA